MTDAAAPGETVLHYRIEHRLGAGGMGVVYRALDTRLNRPVALKFLPPHLPADSAYRARLLREAMAASALEHPNIGVVHAIEEAADHRVFIVMACYEGETLKDRLEGRRISLRDAVEITLQTARGLAHAHAQGVVHRDIKPSNLILTPAGTLKIVDFGLAKILGGVDLTETGTTMGTAAYMSPEQVLAGAIDYRTDIWSLGVVLYEMIEGRAPFSGESQAAILYAVVHRRPATPSFASGDLGRIVGKCLAQACQDRYPNMKALIADLEIFQARSSSQSEVATETLKPAKRSAPPWKALSLGIVGLAVLAASSWFWLTPHKPAAPPAAAISPPEAIQPVHGPAEAPPVTTLAKSRTPTVSPKKEAPPKAGPYVGPNEGRIVWTGELERGAELDLAAKSPAITGDPLPGVPITVQLIPSSLEIVTAPGAANHWRKLVVRNGDNKKATIVVKWMLSSQ
jgi:serine/threonine protein kinase